MITLENEAKLIALTKQDKSNFNIIYREYVRDVYRYAYSKLWNKDLAEEITSITFLKALESINKFEPKNVSIKFWLFVIARNSIYKQYKVPKDISLNGIEDDDQPQSTEDIEKDEISSSNYLKIIVRIKELNSVDCEIVTLKAVEGFTFEEIAKMVGLRLSAVKMKYYRSIKKIKSKI